MGIIWDARCGNRRAVPNSPARPSCGARPPSSFAARWKMSQSAPSMFPTPPPPPPPSFLQICVRACDCCVTSCVIALLFGVSWSDRVPPAGLTGCPGPLDPSCSSSPSLSLIRLPELGRPDPPSYQSRAIPFCRPATEHHPGGPNNNQDTSVKEVVAAPNRHSKRPALRARLRLHRL